MNKTRLEEIEIKLGTFGQPSLVRQLAGTSISRVAATILDKDSQAITRLKARGYLTNSETRMLRAKLIRRIKEQWNKEDQ